MTFETIVLSDASLDSAMEFVYKHLEKEEYPQLMQSVKTIGGRLTDLELFVQKVKSGMPPQGEKSYNVCIGSAVLGSIIFRGLTLSLSPPSHLQMLCMTS